MKVYNEDKLLVYLTSVVFDTQALHHKNLEFAGRKIDRLAFIDETTSWRNGLQAAAYQMEGEEKIYLIIRGADVGVGKKLFQKAGADDRFIPKSNEDSSFKTSFQDWFYTSLLGSCGLAKIYQYDALEAFYQQLRSQHPNRPILAAGVSLGGFLAQKLYLHNPDLNQARGFSGLSPWWTYASASQNFMKERDFFRQDPHLVTYYSHHDPFRTAPWFARYLGQQKNVLLQPFQSRSNALATFIERIYWAHIPHYYAYSKSGKIKHHKDPSKREAILAWLYQPLKKRKFYNCLIWLLGFIPSLLLLATVFVLFRHLSMQPGDLLTRLTEQGQIWYVLLAALISSGLYMLPSLMAETRYKWLILPLNLTLAWTGWVWMLLLALVILTNASRDLDRKESYGQLN